MRARILAGAGGWLAGVVPLVAVNAANYAGLLGYDDTALAGLVALVCGIVLGGAVAGLAGGRRGRGMPGAASAGGIAALLYATTVIALMFGTGYFESAPALVAEHPIRVSVAVVFCASLLLGIALVVGRVTGKSARPPQVPPAVRQQYARPSGPSRPLTANQWATPGRPAPVPSRARGGDDGGWGAAGARGGYDEGAAYGPPQRDPSYSGAARPASAPRRSGPARRV